MPYAISRNVSGDKASTVAFNAHAFGADAEVWVATLIEIVRGPASAMARGMPDRFAEHSSVPSSIGEKTSLEDAKHCVNNTENEVYKSQFQIRCSMTIILDAIPLAGLGIVEIMAFDVTADKVHLAGVMLLDISRRQHIALRWIVFFLAIGQRGTAQSMTERSDKPELRRLPNPQSRHPLL